MNTRLFSTSVLTLLGSLSPLSLAAMAPQAPSGLEAQAALQTWRADHGSSWRMFVDEETGLAELLYGGHSEPVSQPVSTSDWFLAARQAIESARGLLGVDPASLVEREVLALPMAQVGTTDKVTVSFTQQVLGFAVEGARVNALFDTQGRLLSLHSTALPGMDLSVAPATWTAQRIERVARERFLELEGVAATSASEPQLGVSQVRRGSTRVPRLSWRVELLAEQGGARPEGETLWFDAETGELLGSAELVHNFDVGGTVSAMATPGTQPDTSSNSEQPFPMSYLRLSSSQGDVEADGNGNFLFAGVNGPLQVSCAFVGPFANVRNDGGSDYGTNPTLQTGSSNSILMNPSSQTTVTAQANAYRGINQLRDWVRSVSPNDSHADFTAIANVNQNSNCNAFFNGGSVNFFTSGGGCPNTSYSSVVAHEMGHWLNVRYGTGNGPDGMGEGNADVWAMYLYDTPLVGEGFFGNGSLRTGLNTLQFCGDFNFACHGGEVHEEGKVWMGAAWKVRDALNQALGNALGDDTADALFIGWMASFNQTEIKSIIETQWLLLDDDDGNLNNGSPHYPQIEAGFTAQGWPGVELHPLTIEPVVMPTDSLTESGPYDARVQIEPHYGQALTSTQLHYRVNGGPWQDVNLAPAGAHDFAALLPDAASPAAVEFWFSATDTLGNSVAWPEGGAPAAASFAVGAPSTFLIDYLEGGPGGWTHGTYGDTPNNADEWEHGFSFGLEGTIFTGGPVGTHWSDPAAAASGFELWGVDLGAGGDGRYGNDIHTWLRSPAIDCTGRTGVRVRFKRWASVARLDELSLRVNGVLVWNSGDEVDLLDEEWTVCEYDISSQADGNPAVVVEFEIESNGVNRLGGWQIDDFELLEFGPSGPGCVAPVQYGPAKPSSTTETPTLAGLGTAAPGGGFKVRLSGGALNQPALLFSGPNYVIAPYGGGYRLVGGGISREQNGATNLIGSVEFPLAVTGSMVGSTRYYQVWFRDPQQPDGTGIGLSTGLAVKFCP